MTAPAQPKLYHITHVDNLPAILVAGGLCSDAAMIARGGPTASIGMSTIKQRRLGLPVKCHPGDHVGDYVPFYFCPRSIMLYLIYCANHPDMTYKGGQAPILHLEANLHEVVQWGIQQGRRWAFTLSNAGAFYTEFRNDLGQLNEVDWAAVAAPDFRDAQVKEGKQAEFLLQEFFPWHLVRRIGVFDATVYGKVTNATQNAAHRPAVEVRREWYF
ncbi:type II toxin-antitoxin system toxin DNA ADP-ribosyl transferase DarT [Candidatus Nitrotoga sp. 1052]|uniref:type II toxin-antitoxin system toxin DNA ADP-ribosyl transferase DarT n=1 Tax=Candidatus Nitrotoga sp. 1052 TaxID=2886964 RepID=UPI001EF4EF5E|nr:DUF4433 domain-containing protein [Candidatus Nitrotoga sp. 1052]CAH1072449.1 conserved hypothetical protein [Candidatus Nitrotoga sp. 1052]